MKEAVVLYSGGTDSTCVAALLAEKFDRVHLLTFQELATRGTPVPEGNVARLRAAYGRERFVHHVRDVDWLIERVSYGRYWRDLRRHGLFALSTPGFSSLAWHASALLYCVEQGIRDVADGVTRELAHFPGHMEPVQAQFRRLYSRFGVSYASPVRDWDVPEDRRFLDQMVVDRHEDLSASLRSTLTPLDGAAAGAPSSSEGGRTTGRYLYEKGLMPSPDVKGTALDRSMQHACYPFVLFNVLVFWLWLAWNDYAWYERRMTELFRDKVDDLIVVLEDELRRGTPVL